MSTHTHLHSYPLLLPLAWIYHAAVSIRNRLFDRGVLRSRTFPLPVICIGNLTVGGTGKTPHTEYLIRLLKEHFHVAVLSRGYKRKSKGFVLAMSGTTVEEIGDEPYQMMRKFPEVHVAVDRDRCHGIERLSDKDITPPAEVILLDDAFQHRYVRAGLSILLTDYRRPIFKDHLLPAGRLREPVSGKRRADIIIVSKCPADMSAAEQETWTGHLSPTPSQQVYFSTLEYGALQPLSSEGSARTLHDIRRDDHVLLVTGIASPAAIIDQLSRYTRHITPVGFPDHHAFSASDIGRIRQRFGELPEGNRIIVTTEKDATRLARHPQVDEPLRRHIYVLPVRVAFLQGKQEQFNQNIIEYVRENPRNGSLPEG